MRLLQIAQVSNKGGSRLLMVVVAGFVWARGFISQQSLRGVELNYLALIS